MRSPAVAVAMACIATCVLLLVCIPLLLQGRRALAVAPSLHVINVADARGDSRRSALRSALAGIDYVLIEAHLKEDITDEALRAVHERQKQWLAHERNVDKKQHVPLTQGEVALSLSHGRSYRALLASQEPWRVVAEDDIRVAEGFRECLHDVLTRLPPDFYWLKLEYQNGTAPECHRRRRPDECRIEPYDAFTRPIDCAALYVVSRAGAALLLEANGQGRTWLNADGAMDQYWLELCMGRPCRGRTYHVVPQLAWQDRSFGNDGSHRSG